MTAQPARSAFTLMELLIVATIIGILVSMLLPAVRVVRTTAESTRCAGNLRQLALGTIAFTVDNKGRFPAAGNSWGYTSWVSGSKGRWMHSLDPYVGTFKVFNCPTSTRLQPKYRILDQTETVSWGTCQRGCADAGWVCLYAYNTIHWGRYSDMPAPAGPMTRSKVATMLAGYGPDYTPDDCPLFTDGVAYFDASKTGTYAYFLRNAWGVYFPHRRRQGTAFADGRVKSSSFADFTIVGTSGSQGAIQVR